jgi:large subunit ribosomal protein L15
MSMLHEITSLVPANKRAMRKGRGDSSGKGKTAGRGTKGSGSRNGKYIRRGYEGGQTEFYRRFPKRGFSNHDFANNFNVVNLADLEAQFDAGATIDRDALHEAGLVPDAKLPVKILGNGDVKKKFTVLAGWYTKSAVDKLGAAGGTVQNAKGEDFKFPKPKPKFAKPAKK